MGSTAYNVVKVLHILSAIVGFGGVMLNGIYGVAAKNAGGIEALAISRTNHKVSTVAEKFIIAVPVLGLALVGMSDGIITFSQTWIWLALVLFVIAISLSFGVMEPAAKRMLVLMSELAAAPAGGPPAGGTGGPPPQVAEMQTLGKRMAVVGITLNLFVVALVSLMVFQPA